MSLVPTWVLCDDNNLYKGATLAWAPDGEWFICFDDDDPPELVWQGKHRTTEEAEALLAQAGIQVSHVGPPAYATRFTTKGIVEGAKISGDNFVESTSFFVTITSPPPAGLVVKHGDREPIENKEVPPKAMGQCTIELFGEALSRPGGQEMYEDQLPEDDLTKYLGMLGGEISLDDPTERSELAEAIWLFFRGKYTLTPKEGE